MWRTFPIIFPISLKNGFIRLIRENQWIFGKKGWNMSFDVHFFCSVHYKSFPRTSGTLKSLLIALCESLKFLLYCTVRIPESLWYSAVWILESLIMLHRVKPLKTYLYCTMRIPESPFIFQFHSAILWNSSYSATVQIPEIRFLFQCVNPWTSYYIALCVSLKLLFVWTPKSLIVMHCVNPWNCRRESHLKSLQGREEEMRQKFVLR